jgi:hypothetical protein
MIELDECVAKGVHQFGAERVAPVRAIDRQDCDLALLAAI